MCHVLLFMPLLGLPLFWILPPEFSIPIYAMLIVLSILLYWAAMSAMRRSVAVGMESIAGMTVEIVRRMEPERRGMYVVRSSGELWTARGREGLETGDRVVVVSSNGNNLVVEPLSE